MATELSSNLCCCVTLTQTGFLREGAFIYLYGVACAFRCFAFSRDPGRADNKINLVELTIWCRPSALKGYRNPKV